LTVSHPEATELVNESGSGNIQLLRPNSAEPHIKLSASRLSYYNVPATTSTKTPKIPEHRQQRPAV